eukprot:IDg4291t1
MNSGDGTRLAYAICATTSKSQGRKLRSNSAVKCGATMETVGRSAAIYTPIVGSKICKTCDG